ncbi:MAG: DEAD/DEAH box helicase [Chlamydiia bacterium]
MFDKCLNKEDLDAGKKLIVSKKLKNLLFSEGSYQSEISTGKRDSIFPFVQVSDDGLIKDGLCNCTEDSSGYSCPHIAATYLQIMGGKDLPLHVRFRNSLWNQLCQMAARRHGYSENCLTGENKIQAVSPTGKLLFYIHPQSRIALQKIQEITAARPVETEETSLKFFHLPPEELSLWQQGRPSNHLQYELCFWSDLAKWWMMLADQGSSYKITFPGADHELPRWIHVEFKEIHFGLYIAEVNWPAIIPSLHMVISPLAIHEERSSCLEKITYDREDRSFFVHIKKEVSEQDPLLEAGVDLEGWSYIPGQGFFSRIKESFFTHGVVPSGRVAGVLQQYRSLVSSYLSEETIHDGAYSISYDLSFDAHKSLHIRAFLFTPGDLQSEGSAYFGRWVYILGRGFYEVENSLFSAADTVIPRDQVCDFINRHRIWLNTLEGFHTHLMTVASELHYFLDQQMNLYFESHFDLIEERLEILDFGEWVYIPNKGFFQKKQDKGPSALYSGLVVPKEEISLFIRKHTEELVHLPGFFAVRCPIDAVFIDVMLTSEEMIRIKPHYTYGIKVDPTRVFFFGEYCFIDQQGFSLMPIQMPMDRFLEEKILDKRQENYFLASELAALAPYIRLWDPRLKKAQRMHLCIAEVQQDLKTQEGQWLVDLSYETDVGRVDASQIWQGLQASRKCLFTAAGLIDLKDPRFSWLKSIPKKRWVKQGKQLRITSLEWMRLNAFEQLIEPQGDSVKDRNSRVLLEEFRTMQPSQIIDTTGLKSELRLYQQTGLNWLWFLYCNGLSGLLCDEMGLGKTHQAMALLSAVYNSEGSGKKFLVVCPTSVLYHWEDLLAKFLPDLRVCLFYGLERNLDAFEEEADLLLTSYGTLRSEKIRLSQIAFDVAVFDEVQNVKNIQSQTHKCVKAMQCRMVVGLTGTPLENRLLDLRALFEIILPGYLPAEAQFKEFFVNAIEKGQDEARRSLLTNMIKPFLMRRKKTEVLLELPEKIEEVYYCDLSKEQKELYREVFYAQKDSMVKELSDPNSSKGYIHIFSVLSKLKQICNHPVMINKDYDNFLKYRSGKWDLFVERLQEARESGQKVVVFSQYLEMMDMIEKYLTLENIGFAEIRGSTRNRREPIERFRNDPHCEVFVGSLQAAGSGIELTAASVVIHYDRWWNPAKENQATDRVHRIGQQRGVQVFKFVTKKSVEERIHELIEKKNKLFESVIGYDAQDQMKTMSRQELLEFVAHLEKDLE